MRYKIRKIIRIKAVWIVFLVLQVKSNRHGIYYYQKYHIEKRKSLDDHS